MGREMESEVTAPYNENYWIHPASYSSWGSCHVPTPL